MSNFIHIHAHSHFSSLDGVSTPQEIAERCISIECDGCGLTDHGVVSGHLEFSKEMQKRDLKPILGCELYHGVETTHSKGKRDQAHFIAGAITDEGLRNLWRLTNAASQNFYFAPRVNWAMLEKYNEGLFATSACMSGLVSKGIQNNDMSDLDRYLEVFGDRFYIELHTYPTQEQEDINKALVQIAQERGLPVIFATDAHFASPSQYHLHDGFVAMQTGQSFSTPIADRKMWHPIALYMMEEWEIRNNLHYLPESVVDEALANSVVIGDMCNAQLPEIKRHLPAFIGKDCPWLPTWEDRNPATLLIDLVEKGIYERYGEDPSDEVWRRVSQELDVFLEGGLEHYFLQTWDFTRFCESKGIVRGPGRGSAAGSIVSYCLGITDVEPLHYGLIFERFYNPGRAKGFPDIDHDFPQGDRNTVKAYLSQRWGDKKVQAIGNIIRMKPKAALDKTYKVCDIAWGEKEDIKKIVETVPDLEILTSDAIGWRDDGQGKTIYVMDHVEDEIKKYVERQTEDRQEALWAWLDFVEQICSRVSGYGVHASGVVISDVDLDAELPCYWSASQKALATMFPMKDVENRMFVKQDILGLRNLDTLQDWQAQMKAQGIDVEWSGLDLEEHEEGMWKLLDDGLTLGIFQIEDKPYARKLCKDFKPRSIQDLSAIVALNRPGPIRSGAPESFITRRNGGKDKLFDGRENDFLKDILEPTYGWFLYQEQVIAFFSKLGYSLSDADQVRKILGKKLTMEMTDLRNGNGEWKGKGYFDKAELIDPPEEGELPGRMPHDIWSTLENFSKYSFNLSHSIAYAIIAFRTLYAKYNAPAEFFMACIRTNPDEVGKYVAEARRMGIEILPPDIDHSESEVSIKKNKIYFGLANIKGIGKGTAEYVVNLGKRHDISTSEFLSDAIEHEQKLWEEEKKKAVEELRFFNKKSPRMSCRSNVVVALARAGVFDNYEARSMTMQEIQNTERELLGVILTDTCQEAIDGNADLLSQCDTYTDLEEDLALDPYYVLPGIITEVRDTVTKKDQKEMAIVTIEWEDKDVRFAVFPGEFQSYKFLWKERTPGIFTLKKTEKGINFVRGQKLT